MQKTDFKNLILIWGILLFFVILTYTHHGHLIIDNGREAYYPTQILLGKVLYKDIFNIYGPFSYMFNAFLFKIFGINLNVLYLSGCVCAYFVTTLIYLIARKFLNPFLSFSISFYTILLSMSTPYLFDFIFPYSYGMLYGLVAFLASLFFLLKYQEDKNKLSHLYLSCFFAGLSAINKYDFLPYLLVILFAIFSQKLKIKEYFVSLFLLLSVPVGCFLILFLQGLTIENLIFSIKYIKKLSHSPTLTYFYVSQGIFPHKYLIKTLSKELFIVLLPLFGLFFAVRKPTKITSIIIVLLSIVATCKLFSHISFGFIPILITVLLIINFRNIYNNKVLFFLVVSALSVSMKVYWILITRNYGMFFAGSLMLTLLSVIFNVYKKQNTSLNQRVAGLYIILVALTLSYANFEIIATKSNLISTDRGKIYVNSYYYKPTLEFIKYIKENTKKTDKVVILPEGALINFLIERKSDDYFISLIPPYVETFGESYIIKHFKEAKPEYIVINNWNTQDYYLSSICDSYAAKFCEYVRENYSKEKIISEKFKYTIFKLK